MWHSGSGGDSKLNTTQKVIPHAFLEGVGHKSVYDMSIKDFVDNTTRHLHGNHKVVSEFSSWSASPIFVLNYATKHRNSAYIAVIDTQGLQTGGKNVMFHVPALQPIFGLPAAFRGSYYDTYNWEYLVHGVVEGKHYKADSFQSLCSSGLTNHLPALKGFVHAWSADMFNLPGLIVPVTIRELQELASMARLFWSDPEMCAALTIALFCCKKRTKMGTAFNKNELDEIVQYLGGRDNIPYDWCESLVLCDDIYDPRYEDNKQMVNVMHALSNHCWGKGARARLAHRNRLLTSDAEANVDFLTDKMSSVHIESSTEPDGSVTPNSRSRNGGHDLQR
jgi:hypothetical protein